MAELIRTCPSADCPGHPLCSMCRSDLCADCGGCACEGNLCAWTRYEPDCREVYEADTEEAITVVDGQGRPHSGCCDEHDWRGPKRDTSDEACVDLAQHRADVHEGAAA